MDAAGSQWDEPDYLKRRQRLLGTLSQGRLNRQPQYNLPGEIALLHQDVSRQDPLPHHSGGGTLEHLVGAERYASWRKLIHVLSAKGGVDDLAIVLAAMFECSWTNASDHADPIFEALKNGRRVDAETPPMLYSLVQNLIDGTKFTSDKNLLKCLMNATFTAYRTRAFESSVVQPATTVDKH